MFYVTSNSFIESPNITKPINTNEILSLSMEYFDKDGFELNTLEIEYHLLNDIQIDTHLNHIAVQADWIKSIRSEHIDSGPIIDHSIILTRYEYSGDARLQLENLIPQRYVLRKLLSLVPKWGIDFSIDWVDEQNVCELFHIEVDRYNLEEIIKIKEHIEKVVLNTDFTDAYKSIMIKQDEWKSLPSDDQTDWKAVFFGFPRAFDTRKSIL